MAKKLESSYIDSEDEMEQLTLENRGLHFHFALSFTNYTAGPACRRKEKTQLGKNQVLEGLPDCHRREIFEMQII